MTIGLWCIFWSLVSMGGEGRGGRERTGRAVRRAGGRAGGLADERAGRQTGGRAAERAHGRTGGRTDGRVGKRADGRAIMAIIG